MSFVDDICPRTVGEDRLRLTLSDPDQRLAPFVPVLVSIDYDRALPEGVVLPLELSVTGPSGDVLQRIVYRRFAPSEVTFTPREGGSHLVKLAEQWHNLWWGRLALVVSGDRIRTQ